MWLVSRSETTGQLCSSTRVRRSAGQGIAHRRQAHLPVADQGYLCQMSGATIASQKAFLPLHPQGAAVGAIQTRPAETPFSVAVMGPIAHNRLCRPLSNIAVVLQLSGLAPWGAFPRQASTDATLRWLIGKLGSEKCPQPRSHDAVANGRHKTHGMKRDAE